MDWENHIKNLIKKIKKQARIKVKLPHVNKKNHDRETTFLFKHRFPLYFRNLSLKMHAAKPLAFSLHFLFRRDQIASPM